MINVSRIKSIEISNIAQENVRILTCMIDECLIKFVFAPPVIYIIVWK